MGLRVSNRENSSGGNEAGVPGIDIEWVEAGVRKKVEGDGTKKTTAVTLHKAFFFFKFKLGLYVCLIFLIFHFFFIMLC